MVAEPANAIILVQGMSKVYRGITSGNPVTAIQEINLEVGRGERVAIVGPTGCGKSTFFRIVSGLERPSTGRVEVEGRCPYEEFDWFRGKLGVIFQEARLLPWRTALQNVMLGLEFLDPPPPDREDTARVWLKRLGLAQAAQLYPGELSGGMRQRVAIARAFAPAPQIVLADEAFSKLDSATSAHLRSDFLALCLKQKTTLLLITHRLTEAVEMGQRVLVFKKPGQIVDEIHPNPATVEKDRERLEKALSEHSA